MLEEVDFIEFRELVPLYLYNDVNYLVNTADILGAKPILYVYKKGDEGLVAFALFKRKNKIITSDFQIFYSGIWLKYSLKHQNGRDNLFSAISCLKERYRYIRLILPVEFVDIRPFKWNDFDITIRYTYVKATSLYLNFKRDVRENYKRSKSQGFIFNSVSFKSFNWSDHVNHLLDIGYSNKNIRKYKNWFHSLELQNSLLCFQITVDSRVTGSGILLLDKNKRTAYFILRNIPKGTHQKEINAFVYIEVLKWLNANGYDFLDYMGANMRNIADFKERFLPVLTPYYIVEFKPKNVFNLHGIKKLLRTFLIKYCKF